MFRKAQEDTKLKRHEKNYEFHLSGLKASKLKIFYNTTLEGFSNFIDIVFIVQMVMNARRDGRHFKMDDERKGNLYKNECV